MTQDEDPQAEKIYELNQDDFNYVKFNFRNLKIDDTQIKIEISGTEIVFILENSYKEEPIIVEEEKKEEKVEETFFSKLKNLFTSKKSS